MHPAPHKSCSIVKFEKHGLDVGVLLGADFCAAHEWGIADLERHLGVGRMQKTQRSLSIEQIFNRSQVRLKNIDIERSVETNLIGIPKRTMTAQPACGALLSDFQYGATLMIGPHVRWYAQKDPIVRDQSEKVAAQIAKEATLIRVDAVIPSIHRMLYIDESCGPRYTKPGVKKQKTVKSLYDADEYLSLPDNHGLELRGAWDERGFCVHGIGTKAKQLISDLAEAYLQNDLCLTVGEKIAFSSPGLAILMPSRLPEQIFVQVAQMDKDYTELQAAAKMTGIEDILAKAGLGYFELKPKWSDDKKNNLMFYLIPRDRTNHETGWFGLEDLKAWANGKGPIIKVPQASPNRPQLKM